MLNIGIKGRCAAKLSLDVLLSCMHQKDMSIVEKSGITGDAIVINQCDCIAYSSCSTANGRARMFSTTQRGLTKSRNMAIRKSSADICLLCDDDEHFEMDYRRRICRAYQKLPQADVIIFKISNQPSSLPDKVCRLRFPQTMHVSSWQISFRRRALIDNNVFFDELLGAGSGNGAEEELKFLCDCEKAGLRIYYVPAVIASVAQTESTWFSGFNKEFFERRGATTRYILGFWLSSLYAIYYVLKKHDKFEISAFDALISTFKGILKNRISKQNKQ